MTTYPGYRVQAGSDEVDVLRFRRLCRDGGTAARAGEWAIAWEMLGEALGLWRGDPLADVPSELLRQDEVPALEQSRLEAAGWQADAGLHLGRHAELVPRLQSLAVRYPLRERFHTQLMLALARSGRRAEALEAYQRARQVLAEELGTEPGAELRELHQQVLVGDRALYGPEPADRTGSTVLPVQTSLAVEPPANQGPAARRLFVGREHELAALRATATAATHGEPRVVLVEGEAGIGKSSLLAQFTSGQPNAMLLRASGDEAEVFLPYGVIGQLVSGAGGNGNSPQGLLAADLSDVMDPLAVGAELGIWLGRLGRGREMVLVVIDDLQWADTPSARALLFAVRHIQTDRVLIVVSARAGELARLGQGWRRFLAGDHRADRIRLDGLGPEDMVALAQAMGAGTLSRRATDRLLDETCGNPLYCRVVLEEPGAFARLGGPLQVPRSVAEVVLGQTDGLSPAARELVTAAAVLGPRCRLGAAAELADLSDPLPAMEETRKAGFLAERPGIAGREAGFTHPLLQRAIYGNLSLARRRKLHQRAAGLVDQERALSHRAAAAAGPDDALAGRLEAAGQGGAAPGPDSAGSRLAGTGGDSQQRSCGARHPEPQ